MGKRIVYNIAMFIIVGLLLLPGIKNWFSSFKKLELSDYLKNSVEKYEYVTSVTGQSKQKAHIYKSSLYTDTNPVTLDIIEGINGETENISQNSEDVSDKSISILTKNEYAIVYIPEDETDKVYIQVSSRKYNYSTDQTPYKSTGSTGSWYRSHYYTYSYSRDSSRYKNIPSSYDMYNGPIVHDLGNGYFDSYSSNIRQANINARESSGGGLSSGK